MMEDIRNANSEDHRFEEESELGEAHELRRAYRAQLKARHPHLYYKPYEQVEESLDITAELPSERSIQPLGPSQTTKLFNTEKMLDYIHNEIGKLDVPGYSWAIVVNGNLAKSGANGYARGPGPSDSPSREMSAKTKMISGSMAKSICAVAAMQLVEKNKIKLNDKFFPLISSFYPNANVSNVVKQMTIRNLLEHSTGFVHGDKDDMSNLNWLNDHIIGQLESSPTIPNGSSYANVNFFLLARVVESASGQKYIDYVQDKIVKVLNNYPPTTTLTNKEEDSPCLYYRDDEYSVSGNIGDVPPDWQGATGWYASAIDWAKFLAIFRYNKLVSKETKYQMIQFVPGYQDGAFGFSKLGDIKPVGTYLHGGMQNSKNGKGGFYGIMMSFPSTVNAVDAVLLANRKTWQGAGKLISVILREAYLAGLN